MASHFSDIGFNTDNKSSFILLAERAYKKGKRIETDNGIYVVWRLKSGVEVWDQLDKKGELIGMTPGFKGESLRKVSLIEAIIGHKGTLDASFYAWANTKDTDLKSGEYPFIFEVPDFYSLPQYNFPKVCNIQLSAFAHELSCSDNEKEFYEDDKAYLKEGRESKPQIRFALESFIPSGLFSYGVGIKKDKRAEAVFAGKVIKWEKMKNEYTKNSFIWILVKTLGGEVDVVTDPLLLNKEPIKDGYIRGSFWLSGRILKD